MISDTKKQRKELERICNRRKVGLYGYNRERTSRGGKPLKGRGTGSIQENQQVQRPWGKDVRLVRELKSG